MLLDLVDPPPLVALLRKLLVHDEWTTLRMCDPAPPCVLSSLDRSTVVWPLLTGSVLAAGCCRFAIQSRTYPTSTHTTSELGTRGYIGWHRDFEGPGIGISVNPSAVIKVSQPAESAERMHVPSSIPTAATSSQPHRSIARRCSRTSRTLGRRTAARHSSLAAY